MIAATDITARLRHRIQVRRSQRRVLDQRLRDERPKRIDAHRAKWRCRRPHSALGEHPAHGVAVQVQLARDGSLRQCSTSCRRRICALKFSGMVIGALRALDGGMQGPAHRRTVKYKAQPHPRRERAAAAPAAAEGRIDRCDRLGSTCRQWSIAGSDERTLIVTMSLHAAHRVAPSTTRLCRRR